MSEMQTNTQKRRLLLARISGAARLLEELADIDADVYGAGHTEREGQYRQVAEDLRSRLAEYAPKKDQP